MNSSDWTLEGNQQFTISQTNIVLYCDYTMGSIKAISKRINVDNFDTLYYSLAIGGDSHSKYAKQFVYSDGYIDISTGTGTIDISEINGEAYFYFYAKSVNYIYNNVSYISNAKLTINQLSLK